MLRNLFCMFVAAVSTAFFFPFCVLFMLVTLNPSASMIIVQRWWSPLLLWAGGATLHVTGKEHLVKGQPYIFVSNHQSTIDIPALFFGLWPHDFRFVAKKVLQYVPFSGWYMTLAKFVFIDRSNHRAAIKSLKLAGERIRGGVSVVMFAEGTRSENRTILPFKKGPFMLALKSGVPIVPVAIEGALQVTPKRSNTVTPNTVRVVFGKAFETKGLTGARRDELIRNVRASIIRMHRRLGGLGGDVKNAIAASGVEGIGHAIDEDGVTG